MNKKKAKIINKGKNENVIATIDIVDCPRCGNPAHWDIDHRTFKQTVICRTCGYASTDKIIKGKHTSKLYHHEHLGAGTYEIRFKRHRRGHPCGTQRVLPDPHREKVDWEEILSWFRKTMKNPEVDPDHCFLTKYDEKTRKIIALIGYPFYGKKNIIRVRREAPQHKKRFSCG
jgi:hypothetical protein